MQCNVYKSKNYFIFPLIRILPENNLRVWAIIITIILACYMLSGYQLYFMVVIFSTFISSAYFMIKIFFKNERKMRIKANNTIPIYFTENIQNYHILIYDNGFCKELIDLNDKLGIDNSFKFFIFKSIFYVTYVFINIIFPLISLIIICIVPYISDFKITFILFFLLFTLSYFLVSILSYKTNLKYFIGLKQG